MQDICWRSSQASSATEDPWLPHSPSGSLSTSSLSTHVEPPIEDGGDIVTDGDLTDGGSTCHSDNGIPIVFVIDSWAANANESCKPLV